MKKKIFIALTALFAGVVILTTPHHQTGSEAPPNPLSPTITTASEAPPNPSPSSPVQVASEAPPNPKPFTPTTIA